MYSYRLFLYFPLLLDALFDRLLTKFIDCVRMSARVCCLDLLSTTFRFLLYL